MIIHYDLVHSFPVDSEASFAQIAESSGLLENDVSQIIRRAALQGNCIDSTQEKNFALIIKQVSSQK